MALKTNTVVTRVDDRDGSSSDDVKTRRITIDVETELSDANFAAVNAEIAAVLGKARKAGSLRKAPKARVAAAGAGR